MLKGLLAKSRGLLAPLLLSGLVALSPCLAGTAFAGGAHLNNQSAASLEKIAGPFTFVVIGDNRTGVDVYRALVEMIVKDDPAFVMNTGDAILHPGSKEDWEEFVEASKPITMPYFLAPGNHEITDKNTEKTFKDNVRQPGREVYYSFVAGNALFIVLDSEQPDKVARITGAQYRWLKEVLRGSKEKFKFVFLHRPLYPDDEMKHKKDSMNKYEDKRDRLEALFKKHGVDAVFAGHEHVYDRKEVDGIIHVITGGGGAPLYSSPEKGGFYHYIKATVDNKAVDFKVVDIDGNIKDEFRVVKD